MIAPTQYILGMESKICKISNKNTYFCPDRTIFLCVHRYAVFWNFSNGTKSDIYIVLKKN